MKVFRIVFALAASLFSLSALSLTSSAQAAPPAGLVVGSVDLQRLNTGYIKKGTLDQQLQALNQTLTARFQQQSNSAMLTKDQQAQLSQLLAKPAPTDSDRAQIAALSAQSSKDSQELATLQQKKDLTDADKARLTALTQQQQAGGQALQEVSDLYSKQLSSEQEKLNVQLTETVKAAIVAVAKDRKLDVVFNADVAIYTANDITDDVLKRLNK